MARSFQEVCIYIQEKWIFDVGYSFRMIRQSYIYINIRNMADDLWLDGFEKCTYRKAYRKSGSLILDILLE